MHSSRINNPIIVHHESDKKNIIKITRNNPKYGEDFYYHFTLNNKQDIITSFYLINSVVLDPFEQIFFMEYDYDAHNNWVRQYIFDEEKLPFAIVERSIDYY